MQRETGNTESITIEYGFLDSTKDDVNQLKNNWKTYAEAAVQGILNYIQGSTIDSGVHIVKAGESLYSIAQKYNTTVDELKRLNNLTSNNLSIGQRLIIPVTTSTPGGYYIVKAGDTLYSIAQKHNTTVDEIKRLNNLTSNNLYVGQKLVLNSNSSNTSNNTSNGRYTVKLGDTLYSIAKKYNITVDELMDTNNLNSSLLSVGQELIIPTEGDYYIVKAGDTLYSIARKYNTTVDDLINKNNLNSNILSIGQQLKV